MLKESKCRSQPLGGSFCERLHQTLQPAMWCMVRLIIVDGKDLLRGLMLLPPDFLPKLCCLMCDGLRHGSLPDCTTQGTRGSMFTHMVVTMAQAVGRCLSKATEAGTEQQVLDLMLGPAVAELARLSTVICSKANMRMYSKEPGQSAAYQANPQLPSHPLESCLTCGRQVTNRSSTQFPCC